MSSDPSSAVAHQPSNQSSYADQLTKILGSVKPVAPIAPSAMATAQPVTTQTASVLGSPMGVPTQSDQVMTSHPVAIQPGIAPIAPTVPITPIDIAPVPPPHLSQILPESVTEQINASQSASAIQPLLPQANTIGASSATSSAQAIATGFPAYAVPTVVQNVVQDQFNPPQASGALAKEIAPVKQDVVVEQATQVQTIEQMRTPEIGPEIEAYMAKVAETPNQIPQEIVIAAEQTAAAVAAPKAMARAVVVLPITPEEERLGATKSPTFSVRWLVEWSRKIMKMFAGKVVYRFVQEKKK